jgi:kinesin family protein 22
MLVLVLCRSEATVHSAKKPVSTVSTSINMKRTGAKSIQSGRYHTVH